MPESNKSKSIACSSAVNDPVFRCNDISASIVSFFIPIDSGESKLLVFSLLCFITDINHSWNASKQSCGSPSAHRVSIL